MDAKMKAAHLLYVAVLGLAACCAIARFIRVNLSMKIICLLVLTAALCEIIALVQNIAGKSNTIIYTCFAFAELIGMCLYFNYSLPPLKKYGLGYILALAVTILGIRTMAIFQTDAPHVYFTFVKCLLLVTLTFYAAFTKLLPVNETRPWSTNTHFQIAALINFYFTGTFMARGIYDHVPLEPGISLAFIHYTLIAVNSITYLAYFYILYRIPHKTKNG